MAIPSPKKPGSLVRTVVVGLLILFLIALAVGTLTVLFP
ncbi:hypothetical protein SAMN06269250_1550 [Spirosoma fluviale]|uniref:Uncharacterized protein n=1 Tax=Spirosoma fluviale TaxID=1597977 RepID=A0A286FBX7_9BACT|nr:hypothetical protein SAMN06269250_1550 [Spirosoma fluviale]